MSLKLKSVFKVLAPIVMVAMSSNAHAIKWVSEFGLHVGGDNLATATYTDGSTSKVDAGAGISLGIGPQIDLTSNTHIRALINWKSDSTKAAANGSVTFTRYPIDVLYFYQTEQWNFGGGLTYHLSPALTGDGIAGGVNGNYDSALGFVGEVDFRLGEFFYIGGKYTSINYKPQQSGEGTVDGNSFGIVMGFVFGD